MGQKRSRSAACVLHLAVWAVLACCAETVLAATCPKDAYQALIYAQGATNYFKLDNSFANEVSGHPSLIQGGDVGSPATSTPGAFATDVFGNLLAGYSFHDQTDMLTVSDVVSGGSGAAQGSMSMLFRALEGVTSSKRYLLSQGTASPTAFTVFFENSAGSGVLKIQVGNTSQAILASNAIAFGTWYYLAITWDETRDAGEVKWYLGRVGHSLNSGTINLNDTTGKVGDNGTVYVGNQSALDGGYRNPGDGALDEIAFWDRELSQSQIEDQFELLNRDAPSINFDLTRWELTLPVDDADTFTGLPRVIDTAQLNSGFEYVDPADCEKKYFFTGAGNAMVFQTPTNGAVKPGGDPRSELRATLPNGDEHNWTASSEGGVHILDAICAVNAGDGKIVIGQIHAESSPSTNPPVPAVILAYDTRASSPFLRVTVKHDPGDSNNGQTTNDFAGVPLNGLIHYQLKMVGGSNSVLLYVTVNGVTWTMDMNANGHSWTNTTFYFKAGCYFPDFEAGSPTAQVSFYKLFQSAVPSQGGLVSLWRGEGNANDAMGRNNGSTQNGATFTTGIVGQGFSLDGDDDYVRILDSSSLDLSGGFTMELWYKSTAGAHVAGLFDKRNMTVCNYGVHFGAHNNLEVYFDDPNVGGYQSSFSPTHSGGVAGVFHHFLATFEQTNGSSVEIKTYIDGELVQVGAQPGNLEDSDNNDPLAIGTLRDNLGGPGYNFQGVIDEVALYSRVLTAEEALIHYKALSGVVARWHGDDDADDAVGSNDGTMMHGATFAAAVRGSGFSLDGDDDYVRVLGIGSLNVGTALSLEMWYNRANDQSFGGLIDKRNWDTCNFGIHWHNDANFVVYYNDPNHFGFEHSLTPENSAGLSGYFHHLVATYEQTETNEVTIKTYVDGELVQTDAQPGNLGETFNDDPLGIGTIRDNLGGAGYNFHGIIDEVTIYNRALSSGEVLVRYIGGLPEFDTIVGWDIQRGMGGDGESIYHSWTLNGDHPYSYLEVQRKYPMDATFEPWDVLFPTSTTFGDSDPSAVQYRIRIVSPKGAGPWETNSVPAL